MLEPRRLLALEHENAGGQILPHFTASTVPARKHQTFRFKQSPQHHYCRAHLSPILPITRSFLRLRAAPCFVQTLDYIQVQIPRHNSHKFPQAQPPHITQTKHATVQPTTTVPSPSTHHNPSRKHPPNTLPQPQTWRATLKKRTRCSSASALPKPPKQASSTSTEHDGPNSSPA